MYFNKLYLAFQKKLRTVRPFLRTKIGSRLTWIGILLFVLLFFAPLFHGGVGTAIVACIGAVYLLLIWRKHDRDHVIVPAVFLTIPMVLDMLIYRDLTVISCLVVAIGAMYIVALSPWLSAFDALNDTMYLYLSALGICVGVVIAASLLMVLVSVAWWILCLVAFIIVIAGFLGVVFSTAAYTASDGRRQARRRREQETLQESSEPSPRRDYRSYRPPTRDTKIYNLSEDDFTDIED